MSRTVRKGPAPGASGSCLRLRRSMRSFSQHCTCRSDLVQGSVTETEYPGHQVLPVMRLPLASDLISCASQLSTPHARSSLRVMSGGGGGACPRLPEAALLFTVRPLRRPDISVPTVWPLTVVLFEGTNTNTLPLLEVEAGHANTDLAERNAVLAPVSCCEERSMLLTVRLLSQDLSMPLYVLQQHAERATGVPVCQQTIWIVGAERAS